MLKPIISGAFLVAFLFILISDPTGALTADVSAAEASAPVIAIDIKGLKRIDEQAVRMKMTQKPGEPLSVDKVSDDIKAIYDMGYFEDIKVEMEPFEGGMGLVYYMVEKPSVRSVEFYGNDEVADSKIQEVISVSSGSMADTALIQDSASATKSLYEREGYPLANVVPIVRRISGGNVLLTYYIEEGPRVKIRRVEVEGNDNVSDRKVRKVMATSKWHWWSFLTTGGFYQRRAMADDVVSVRNLYYDKGFLAVSVAEPVLTVSEDKRWMDVTLEISEGAEYKVSSVGLKGNTVFSEEEVRAKAELAAGDPVSRGRMAADSDAITDMYTEKGYALANVYPEVVPDERNKEADVVYRIHEGGPFTVGKINITGNFKTRDKVIRREVRLNEGDDYNGKLIKRSYQRILNLKYFEQVKLRPVPRVDAMEMDLNIEVEERATGSLMVGAGYSTVDKFVALVEFTQGNLGGKGRTLKLKSEFGNISSTYELTYTEPWLFDREVSSSASVYRTNNEYTSYDKKATGLSLGIGRSFAEYWREELTYNLEEAEITDIDEDASNIIWSQEGVSLTSSITPAILRDSRDNVLDTHRGSRNKLSVTYAGIGGDNKFYKVDVDSGWYLPATKSTTLALRGRYGQAEGLYGEELPLYERYYVGGITTLRGLRDIGSKDDEGDYIGGTKRLLLNVDYVFPLFPEMKLNGVVFFDSGTAFDDFEDLEMRHSTGLGVRWISPLGPLRLEWAYNIDPEPGESRDKWEFTIGTFF